MSSVSRRQFLATSLTAAGAVCLLPRLGWTAPVPGVEITAAPTILGEERVAQPDIWALEMNFKPVRMIHVEMPDRTGKVERQLIWYMVYRVIRRPVAEPNKNSLSFDNAMFVPEFLLVTEQSSGQKMYYDRVMPIAQAAINKRERREYKNTVEIVGPMPPETPYKAKTEKSLDGVAMWRGIDPTVTKFKVFMSGFSNGYRKTKGPNGEDLIERKTIVQEFWRPGDEFDQNEEEIRVVEQPKWIYR